MALHVSRIKCDASEATEIVIHSLGSDGMETNRDILSLAEAERLILSIRRAIGSSRPGDVNVGHRPSHGAAMPRWQGGRSRIGISDPDPDLICRICDDNDPCLPRWEDDGGGTARPQPPVQAWEGDSESNHEHHVQRRDGKYHRSIRGLDGVRRGGGGSGAMRPFLVEASDRAPYRLRYADEPLEQRARAITRWAAVSRSPSPMAATGMGRDDAT